MSGKIPLHSLSEAKRQQAMERFRIIQPFVENGVPLTAVAAKHQLPLRTLRRWVQSYRSSGLTGLARSVRADSGARKMPMMLKELIEGLVLQKPPPSIASVHRKMTGICQEQGWAAPSYSSVYDIAHKLDPALVTLAHEGEKRYREMFDLIHRREATRSNEIWQADHTLLDIWVLNGKDKPDRPWLTIIIDDYSRAIAGYFLSFKNPSAMQTSLALHQAIWRKQNPYWHICGIPDIFYTDHGSDFTSHHMEQVAVDLKMRLVFSLPGMPRGRGKIERFFETVNQCFLSSLPGFICLGQPTPDPVLTLSQLDAQFMNYLNEYHAQEHSETGAHPQDRWETAFLPRLPDSRTELDLLLLQVAKARRIHPDGIHLNGFRYMDITLASFVREEVTVRYDPRDMAEIRVFFRDQFLCSAICPDLADQQIDLKDIIRARNQRRKQLKSELHSKESIVEAFLGVHNVDAQQDSSAPAEIADGKKAGKSTLKRYHNE
jgi:putative transposase